MPAAASAGAATASKICGTLLLLLLLLPVLRSCDLAFAIGRRQRAFDPRKDFQGFARPLQSQQDVPKLKLDAHEL
jgi:hypothetical protein